MRDEFDDDLPPRYERPGVAPVWRLIAVLSLLAVGGLLCMTVVLLISIAGQGINSGINNGWAMPVPPMAVAAANAPAQDDDLEAANSPYPLHQDLRPRVPFLCRARLASCRRSCRRRPDRNFVAARPRPGAVTTLRHRTASSCRPTALTWRSWLAKV